MLTDTSINLHFPLSDSGTAIVPGRLSLRVTYAVAGVVAASQALAPSGSRVPTQTLALAPAECQAGPGSPSHRPPADRMPRVDLASFSWLLTDDGQRADRGRRDRVRRPRRRSRRRRDRPARAAGAGRRPRPAGGGAHPGRSCGCARCRSSARTRCGCTSPPTVSSRRPATGSREHRAARLVGRRRRVGGRPRLRHRRRPGRVRPGRAHHRRRGPRPGPGGDRRGQPRGARPRGRGAGRRRDHARPRALRRGVRRPGPPLRRGRVFDVDGWTPPWPFVAGLLGAAAPPAS